VRCPFTIEASCLRPATDVAAECFGCCRGMHSFVLLLVYSKRSLVRYVQRATSVVRYSIQRGSNDGVDSPSDAGVNQPDPCAALASASTPRITAQARAISSAVSVGCTRKARLVSPSLRAVASLACGRNEVPSKAFSR